MMKINSVEINKKTVLQFLGYKNRKVPSYIDKVIDEEIEKINDILDIKVYINEIDCLNHKFQGDYIKNSLEASVKSYAILYTIGKNIDENILYHTNNNDMIRGMVLDKIGIVALDYVGEKIKNYLEEKNNPLNISLEIYPGDKGFDIENQNLIYDYVKNNDISINEYGQMSPIKSVALVLCLSLDNEQITSRCENCLNKCF